MPKEGPSTSTADSKTISILISHNNKLFYYLGDDKNAFNNNLVYSISYDKKKGIGKIIRDKQLQLEIRHIDTKELVVLIKPTAEATYKNTVDVLDEMTINGVTRYAIVKPQASDIQFLKNIRR